MKDIEERSRVAAGSGKPGEGTGGRGRSSGRGGGGRGLGGRGGGGRGGGGRGGGGRGGGGRGGGGGGGGGGSGGGTSETGFRPATNIQIEGTGFSPDERRSQPKGSKPVEKPDAWGAPDTQRVHRNTDVESDFIPPPADEPTIPRNRGFLIPDFPPDDYATQLPAEVLNLSYENSLIHRVRPWPMPTLDECLRAISEVTQLMLEPVTVMVSECSFIDFAH